MKKAGILVLLLFLATTSPEITANEIESTAQLSNGLREDYLRNPVFTCDTYIFEAGRNRQQTIFLVHGVGDQASDIWRSLAADLSKTYHIVAFDLPGFGRSGKENTLYSPQRYVEFIDWLVNEFASGKIILVGHSLGGALALNYASDHPERISHLVLIDAAGILHRIALTKNFLQISPPATEGNLATDLLTTILNKPIKILNHVTGSTVENLENEKSETGLKIIMSSDSSRQMVLGGKPSVIAGLALAQENFTEIINKTTVPTSLIWGRLDDVAPLRTGKLLAGKLSNSRLRIIDDAGHVPILEQPEHFLKTLEEELDSPPVRNSEVREKNESQRIGVCREQNNIVFSGDYDRIEIADCQEMLLKNVRARHIEISRSLVKIEDSSIHSNETALVLQQAKIIGTNLLLEGEIAIQAESSRLDLAGVDLRGKTAAIQTQDKALVLFSVSRVTSPHTKANLHGVVRISPDKPL